MSAICKYESIIKKLSIFKPNLLGKFYSTLNFLSNGIQYVWFIRFKNFHYFLSKCKRT